MPNKENAILSFYKIKDRRKSRGKKGDRNNIYFQNWEGDKPLELLECSPELAYKDLAALYPTDKRQKKA